MHLIARFASIARMVSADLTKGRFARLRLLAHTNGVTSEIKPIENRENSVVWWLGVS